VELERVDRSKCIKHTTASGTAANHNNIEVGRTRQGLK